MDEQPTSKLSPIVFSFAAFSFIVNVILGISLQRECAKSVQLESEIARLESRISQDYIDRWIAEANREKRLMDAAKKASAHPADRTHKTQQRRGLEPKN